MIKKWNPAVKRLSLKGHRFYPPLLLSKFNVLVRHTHNHTNAHKHSLKNKSPSVGIQQQTRLRKLNPARQKLEPLSSNLLSIIYLQIRLEMNTRQPAKWIQENASLHLSEVVLSHNSPSPNPPIPMNTMLWCVLQPLACCDNCPRFQ